MDHFSYRDRDLYCEGIPAADLAERFGTPLYVYSSAAFVGRLKELQSAFAELDPLVCYSVKANSNLGVLKLMGEHGSGFDVVSGGELHRVSRAGGEPSKTVFAGVGKTDEEILDALRAGVMLFNVESEAELEAIDAVAKAEGVKAPVALRVNPDVDPKTHRYISTGKKESKFGMDIDRALRSAELALGMEGLAMTGLHMHIGSQITTTEPYGHAAAKSVELVDRMRKMGHDIQWCNMGGGFGIDYRGGESKPIAAFAEVMVPLLKKTGCRLAMEPGRSIAGNAGILLSRVIFNKQSGDKRFVIQDAAMNDLIRPALYEGFHRILAGSRSRRFALLARGLRGEHSRHGTSGHRRARLREWRLPGQGPSPPSRSARRPPRRLLRRRLRHGHGLELQHPTPGGRDSGRWHEGPGRATSGDARRPAWSGTCRPGKLRRAGQAKRARRDGKIKVSGR